MAEKAISRAVIKRLPRYYRFLGDLMDEGVERISSGELSARMDVTASQIRQDLNNFGGFGQQGYGYNVKYLHEEIAKILGLDKQHHLIIVGAGNLGQALAKQDKFDRLHFKTIGLFDMDQSLVGKKIRGVEIYHASKIEEFVKANDVDIAVITVPKEKADEAANRLVNLGVKAFWNFAHLDLTLPEDVAVENVHLSDSLMQLSYKISGKNEQ